MSAVVAEYALRIPPMQAASLAFRRNPFALSQRMSRLSTNLNARRKELGLTVVQVHQALNRRGIDVAFSTVAGWFNGNRGVKSMEHLKALCAVLQTDMNSLTSDDVEVAEGPMEATIAREVRDLPAVQQEAVLALIRSMRGTH